MYGNALQNDVCKKYGGHFDQASMYRYLLKRRVVQLHATKDVEFIAYISVPH